MLNEPLNLFLAMLKGFCRRFDFMTCYSPLQGYRSIEKTVNGKRGFTRNAKKAYRGLFGRPQFLNVPCNRCIGCRLRYSRDWAVRCWHEASLYKENSFITLTYNDKYLPGVYNDDGYLSGFGTLNYDHWTKFVKRLRKALEPLKIRFYMGAEYGEENLRPHYHAIIFNYGFPDKLFYTERYGHRLYRSELLERLWADPKTGESYGYSTVGSCTLQSAAYVARYMLKKVKGEDLEGRYLRFNPETGESYKVAPELARMSNRNGIGKEWFDEYCYSDVYNKDFLTINGSKYRPPAYYDALLERLSPEDYASIKSARQNFMDQSVGDRTIQRLKDAEICKLASINKLKRDLGVSYVT